MGILMYIGMGFAKPEMIDELLDIEISPRKPRFDIASAVHLALVDCDYESSDISWRWSDDALSDTAEILAENYALYSAKAEILRHMFTDVKSKIVDENIANMCQAGFLRGIVNPDPSDFTRFELESTKTIAEKQTTSKRRQVTRLMNRGRYLSAAQLRHEHLQEVSSEG